MNFLYPAFLYGLAALAIPIIVHLFNFRKAKKVYFSSNQFLKNLKKKTSAKLKLKHLLVLAARLLFIFFLVLAFAQPYIPAANSEAPGDNVYIYVDNSLSMSNLTGDDATAFETGIGYINEIIRLYPKNTRYTLLTNDFAPFSNNSKSVEELEELLTELQLSGVSRSFEEIYDRLMSGNAHVSSPHDIYWISDFQKSTLGPLADLTADTVHNFYFAPLPFLDDGNVFVDSIYLENPFIMANEKNELKVSLRNSGQEEVEDLIVKLYINEVQAASASVDLSENTTAEISFPLSYGLEPVNRCRISFEEFPVVFDNEFYFTISQMDKINVLEVKNTFTNTPVTQAFGNAALFNLMSFHVQNLEYNLIASADLVVLNELQAIDPSLIGALTAYLEAGGDLMIIPAQDADYSSYAQLASHAGISANQSPVKQELGSPDLGNPFFENIFEETDQNFDMPEAANVMQWRYQAGKLLSHKNGDPYLSVFSGDGAVYLLGSPLDEQFTQFHQHAIFVPVMYRIAALSKEINANLYHTLDEPTVDVSLDSLNRNQIFKLTRGDQELIPAQMISGNNLVLELPRFILKSGFYSLTLGDQTKKVLAFNQAKNESMLSQYASEELRTAFSGADNLEIFNIENADDFGAQMQAKHQGVPLWRYVLLLALFFLLAEVLLLRFL